MNLLDVLLDENNRDPICMSDDEGRILCFEQVAVIPYRGRIYCILKPLDKVKGIKESLETISKSQESSVKSRKELATKTKELRSVAAGERMTFMKGLLKSYQEEIDHLTIRSQYLHFRSLYCQVR